MVKVREVIVVEGRYDKNTLSQVVNATIFTTEGFGIFRNPEQLALLRLAAQKRGLIILTDSDGAGFVIRSHLKSVIDPKLVKNAYIPDVFGKERRKSAPGKEGKLGVEGMRPDIILESLRKAGATFDGEEARPIGRITKADFVELGLSGSEGSSQKRLALLKKLGLPQHMSANTLIQALNVFMTREELSSLMTELEKENG